MANNLWKLVVHHADEFSVSGGGLKSTYTGNTRGPPGVSNCIPGLKLQRSAIRIVIWDPPGNSASSSMYGF